MKKIHFGTDGWRAVIADDFTIDNVKIIAQAAADYLNTTCRNPGGVAISFDTRFMSDRFALTVAQVLASNKINVFLSEWYTPTPVLSYAVKSLNLDLGIMITASHNPYFYNGIKFKSNHGGPVSESVMKQIKSLLAKKPVLNEPHLIKKYLKKSNFFPEYKKRIAELIDLNLISNSDLKIVFNPMHGAGSGYLGKLLSPLKKLTLKNIHQDVNPYFGFIAPEPILKNLAGLKENILNTRADIAIAADGDADRFGVLDQNGDFVELHDLFTLLFRYCYHVKNWKGNIVRTTSMADTIDRAAKIENVDVHEVPVGFKHISEKMSEKQTIIGGEESGGFGYSEFMPERDGLFSALLTLEMIIKSGKSLTELVKELRAEFGPFNYGRIDAYGEKNNLALNMELLRNNPPDKIAGLQVNRVSGNDGIKFYFEDNSWMLIRNSDTEPLFRVYVTSESSEITGKLLKAGELLMKRNQNE